MTATDKSVKKAHKKWHATWKGFFIAASVTANIAFIVAVITMVTTHALDGMFMNEGLQRYCNAANDGKFSDNTEKTKALREFTCARGDADIFFRDGFQHYLDYKGITS